MTTTASKKQAGPSSPRAGLPATLPTTAEGLGNLLEALMVEWAKARYTLTRTYAKAYLAAVGADGLRTQAAKLAAAEDQLQLDYARAAVEGCRVILTGLTKLGVPDGDAE